MITLYVCDTQWIFNHTINVDEEKPIPAFSIQVPPPEITSQQQARWDINSWVIEDKVIQLPSNRALLESLASLRFEKETAGVTLNGQTIKTDRESRSLLSDTYSAMKNGLLTSTDWKMADNSWVSLTLTDIELLARAVVQHVDACFKVEKTHMLAISMLTSVEELASYDISTGWPA